MKLLFLVLIITISREQYKDQRVEKKKKKCKWWVSPKTLWHVLWHLLTTPRWLFTYAWVIKWNKQATFRPHSFSPLWRSGDHIPTKGHINFWF